MADHGRTPTWRLRFEACAKWLVRASLGIFVLSAVVSVLFRFPGIEYDVDPAVRLFCDLSFLVGLATALLGIVWGLACREWSVARRGVSALLLWGLLITVTCLQGDSVRPLFRVPSERMGGEAEPHAPDSGP